MIQHIIPAIAFPPGDFLQDELEALKEDLNGHEFTQQYLADIAADLPQTIDDIINGKQQITSEIATKLSKAFGTSGEFWMNLENNYRQYLVRKSLEGLTNG